MGAKGPEGGLSEERRVCEAGLEGQQVPGRSSVPHIIMTDLQGNQGPERAGMGPQPHSKLVADLGPDHRCPEPTPEQWVK